MKFFIKKMIFPALLFIVTLTLIFYFPNNKSTKSKSNYSLKAYKNTVALYNGEEIIKIYDTIVLNTLPEKDIYQFKSGVPVSSPEQAEIYLEDFDV